MASTKLKTIFAHYVGQEIKMVGVSQKPQVHWDKEDYMTASRPEVDLPDPTLTAMMKTAQDNGLNLVLSLGQAYYQQTQLNRVTAYIEQKSDGRFLVQDRFDLG